MSLGLTYNPALKFEKRAQVKAKNRRVTVDEKRRLLTAVNKHQPYTRWIFSIALKTGLRSSGIPGLRRHQIDVKKSEVRLLTTKNDSA